MKTHGWRAASSRRNRSASLISVITRDFIGQTEVCAPDPPMKPIARGGTRVRAGSRQMSVIVDQQPLAAETLGLTTVGQVLAHLKRDNRLIVHVLIDGKEP